MQRNTCTYAHTGFNHCWYSTEASTFGNQVYLLKSAFQNKYSHAFFHANERLRHSELILSANSNELTCFKTLMQRKVYVSKLIKESKGVLLNTQYILWSQSKFFNISVLNPLVYMLLILVSN